MSGASAEPRNWRSFPPLRDPHSLPAGPVMAFAPHPDDEVIGCGGTLAFHAERGDPVQVVHLTGGEAGDPEARESRDLVRVRQEESRRALAVLGLEDLVGLGQPDGAVVADASLVAQIEELVTRQAPVVVYAPSPLECHADHLACCQAVAAALASSPLRVEFLTYEVNHPTLASFLLDITPRLDRKRDALMQYTSQRRYTDIVGKCLAGAYARTVNVELPEIQYAEAFLSLVPQDLPEVWRELQALHLRLGLTPQEGP